MIPDSPEMGSHSSNTLLRLIAEITGLAVTERSESRQVLSGVVEAAFQISGLYEGTVCLIDYVRDEQHILIADDDQAPRLSRQQNVERTISPQFPKTGQAISHVYKTDGGSFLQIPLISGSHELGILYLDSRRRILNLSQKANSTLQILASLAALAIDRQRRQRNASRLREWLGVFGKLFAESRNPSQPHHRDRLLEAIARNARNISGADFVVLYEYIKERGDVVVPPIVEGSLRQKDVLENRGRVLEHRKSVLFKLLNLDSPFFAERAPADWLEKGLIDRQSYQHEGSFFQREGVASSAGLPLRFDEEIVGVIFLNYREGQAFSQEFRQHLDLFSDYAGLAIGNARLAEQSKRHNDTLKALNQIGHDLSSAVALNIKQIGELIDQRTEEVIRTKNFFLCIYEAKHDLFTIPYIRDEHDTAEALQPLLHQGLTAYVCRTREALLATAEQQQAIFAKRRANLVGNPSAVWLGAPLLVRDEVIGAIVVQDYVDSDAFTEEQKHLLTAIGSQAAIAIDNYRLLHDARQRLTELKALLDISQAFAFGEKSLKELLTSILDYVSAIANCHGSLLLLVEPSNNSQLKVSAASSGLSEYIGKTIHIGMGASGQAVATGQPQIWNDYYIREDRSSTFIPPPRHVCAIPLLWQGKTIGAITLSSHNDRELSQRELDILQRFSGYIAAAVQNNRDKILRNALVHAGPNAIVAVDRSGRIITFNEEAGILFKNDALIGESVARLYWDGRKGARRIQALLKTHSKISEEEIFGRSQDNQSEKIPISLSAALLKEETGEIMGSVGILQDLRLQSLRGRNKLLVDALLELSREEDLPKIVSTVVFAATELLYAEAACLFLRDSESFELASSYRADPNLVERLKLESGRLNSFAVLHPRDVIFLPQQESPQDFRLLPNSQSAVLVPIQTDERLLGYLLVESLEGEHFRTEEKLIEILASHAAVSINRVQLLRSLERNREGLLVNANAVLVGQIATSFIHEAKNSLNGMTLTVHNLHEDIEAESNIRSKKDYLMRLGVVLTEMQRLDQLSRRLQRFTRQGLRPEKRECYLNDIIIFSTQLLDSVLRERHMRFEIKLDPRLGRPEQGKGNPIFVDDSQIQQALMNLIINAVAASPERSPVQVETRGTPESVEVRIRDFGSGITSDDKRHLFTPFFTTKDDGVGLGLYISRLMVEQNHGGTIEIESTAPGKGTTFLIRLPKLS